VGETKETPIASEGHILPSGSTGGRLLKRAELLENDKRKKTPKNQRMSLRRRITLYLEQALDTRTQGTDTSLGMTTETSCSLNPEEEDRKIHESRNVVLLRDC